MATFLVSALLFLRSVLRIHQPNSLLVFFSLPSGPVGLAAKIFFGVPYVISLRGGDVPGLVPELSLLHKCLSPIRRLVLKYARAIVSNSQDLRVPGASSGRSSGRPHFGVDKGRALNTVPAMQLVESGICGFFGRSLTPSVEPAGHGPSSS